MQGILNSLGSNLIQVATCVQKQKYWEKKGRLKKIKVNYVLTKLEPKLHKDIVNSV